jgi:tetratricopeptide (TPR) repeat protein
MTITTFEEWLTQVDTDSENVEKDKDSLYQLVKEGYERFDGKSRADLTWRMGRAAYKVAAAAEAQRMLRDKEKEKNYLLEAEAWAKKALELDANCAEAHLWLALAGGKICDCLGTKERIAKGKEIQHHLEESLRIRQDDFITYYTYGRWCYEVASLSWMERKIAAVIFDAPPEATFADAQDKFLKVHELKPNWKANLYWIAKCAVNLKDYSTAIKYADMASQAENSDEEDLLVQHDIDSIIKKYSSHRK